nr:replication factor A protein 1-like isoform X2 [Ipomoea batatas]
MENRIKCALWDEHVPAVMPFFNNHVDDPLIVLLQLCRAKIVDNEVRISSSYSATKVLFNLDCQEFIDFKNSLKANCTSLRSISVVSYGHNANNSQSPMVVSTIRDLYERAEHVSTRVDRGIENASLIVEEESVAGEGDSTGLDSDTILVRVDVGISTVGVEFENVVRE